jgi:hypothetical protein
MKPENKKQKINKTTEAVNWQVPLADKNALTIEDAHFIFDQAEKLLNDSVATSQNIVSRMNTLITLITAALLAIFGFIISKLGSTSIGDPVFITAITASIGLYILAIFSFSNTAPKTYLLPGSVPKDLLTHHFLIKIFQRRTEFYVIWSMKSRIIREE